MIADQDDRRLQFCLYHVNDLLYWRASETNVNSRLALDAKLP
jgi:hypothetical protein